MMFPIKVNAMKFGARNQKGFSLLEALLSIVIILAAGLGVVELFMSADAKNKVQATQQVVQQVASATNQYISSSYDSTDLPDTDAIISSGLLPQNIVAKDGTAIITPYGTVTITSQSSTNRNMFYVAANSIPGDQAVALCQNMMSASAVYSKAPSSGGASSTALTSLSECGKTFGGKSTTATTVYFAFPKDEYVATASGGDSTTT